MLRLMFFCSLVMLISPAMFFAQPVEFSNSAEIQIPDFGPAAAYPSTIQVNGLPPYLDSLEIEIPTLFHDGSIDDLELLLVAPNGRQILLMSDVPVSGVGVAFSNLRFDFEAEERIGPDNLSGPNMPYRPSNYGAEPDDFPAPGPGLVSGTPEHLFVLEGINPNGEWQLYVVGNELNGDDGRLAFGWLLRIVASDTPVCQRPVQPTVDSTLLGPFSAGFEWTQYDNTNTWDLYYDTTGVAAPGPATSPTLSSVTQNENFIITGLDTDVSYDLYVRAHCGVANSVWQGPLTFRTAFDCGVAQAVGLCETVETASSGLPGFYIESCGSPPWAQRHLFSFIPPATGTFYFRYFGAEDNYRQLKYKALEAGCDRENWQCADFAGEGQLSLDNLEAGVTYLLLYEKDTFPEQFRISACTVPVESPPQLIAGPFDLVIRMGSSSDPVTGILDFYFGPAPLAAPDGNTMPTVSDFAFSLQDTLFNVLNPDTGYDFYYRTECDNGRSCWEGPFTFASDLYCGEPVFLGVEEVTTASMIVKFLAPTSYWALQFGEAPYELGASPVQYFGEAVNDTLIFQLTGLEPSTGYELYLRGECANHTTLQPWQGPYPVASASDCSAVSQFIDCGQYVENRFFVNDNPLFNAPAFCNNSGADGTNLYEFVATETGNVVVNFQSAFFTGNGEVAFFARPAGQGCSNTGWEYLGCWDVDGGDVPNLSFQVEAGVTYYVLSQAYDFYGPGLEARISFRILGCENPCKAVAELTGDNNDEEILLTWTDTTGADCWDVLYFPEGSFVDLNTAEPTVGCVSQTSYAFTAEPGVVYEAYVRSRCGPSRSPWVGIVVNNSTLPLAELEGRLTNCSPQFTYPTAQYPGTYPYDQLVLIPSEPGLYGLFADIGFYGGTRLAVYEEEFQPDNPGAEASGTNSSTPASLQVELEAGVTYVVTVNSNFPTYEQAPQRSVTFRLYGPAEPAFLSGFQFNGHSAGARGTAPPTGDFYVSEYSCVDTAGWRHYYSANGTLDDVLDDYLILSVEDYPGLEVDNSEALVGGSSPGASLITNPPAGYVSNPSGWYTMNRFWNLAVTTQPVEPVGIRFTFLPEDFNAVQNAIQMASGLFPETYSDLTFYKINSIEESYNVDPADGHVGIPPAAAFDGDGYWEYDHGPEASASTWRLDYHLNGTPYAEMPVAHFSGGGGGSAADGGGALTHVRELTGELRWTVFPNPVRDRLFFETATGPEGNFQFRIYSGAGHLLHSGNTRLREGIDMTGLLPGAYLLLVESEGKRLWAQLVKS